MLETATIEGKVNCQELLFVKTNL